MGSLRTRLLPLWELTPLEVVTQWTLGTGACGCWMKPSTSTPNTTSLSWEERVMPPHQETLSMSPLMTSTLTATVTNGSSGTCSTKASTLTGPTRGWASCSTLTSSWLTTSTSTPWPAPAASWATPSPAPPAPKPPPTTSSSLMPMMDLCGGLTTGQFLTSSLNLDTSTPMVTPLLWKSPGNNLLRFFLQKYKNTLLKPTKNVIVSF